MSQHGVPPSGPGYLPAETRAPGTVRTNRLVLALIGLLLLLAGAAVVLLGAEVFGSSRAAEPIISPATTDFVHRNGWYWPAVAVAAALVALLSLRWLVIQGHSNRLSSLPLGADGRDGRTTLPASALTGALEREVANLRGVSSARAHLSGDPESPQLSIRLSLDGRVPARELHQQIVGSVLRDARHALGTESLLTRLEFELPKSSQRDIR